MNPYLPTKRVDLDPETLERLEALAASQGITVEQLLSAAIDRFILTHDYNN